jgi:protein O-GlcNAc transferase
MSLDALWMGAPVVSLCGQIAVSRAGLCFLTNLGLPELVARDANQYVAIAAKLACELTKLSELRAGLRARMESSPLTDQAKFTKDIESAYREIWRDWCK